jgi:hypothetical protein
MRQLLHATRDLAWPSLLHAEGRLLGLPFVLAACAPGLVFQWRACIAALMLASVASFLIYVPMTALALNDGAALTEDAPAPLLTSRAYVLLLVLWTATAWSGAAAAGYLDPAG